MKTKFTTFKCLAIAILLAFTVSSCKKNEVKTIEIQSAWNLSVFDDKITLGEFLDNADTTWSQWLSHDADGNLYAMYNDTIDEVLWGEEILSGFDPIEFSDTISIELPFGKNRLDPIKIDSFATIPFVFDDFSIKSGEIKHGIFDFRLECNQDLSLFSSIVIKTSNIKNAEGQELSLNLDYNNAENAFLSNEDFSGFIIEPNENQEIILSGELILNFKSSNADITLDIKGSITGLALKSIVANLITVETQYSDNIEVDFGIDNITGDFEIFTPKLSLFYQNTFGFEGSARFDSLYFININDEIIDLLKPDASPEIAINTTSGDEYSETGVDGIVESIDIIDQYKSLTVAGLASLSGSNSTETYSIADDNYMKFIASVEVPLAFKASDLTYIDTVELNIEDLETQDIIDTIEFNFTFTNTLPLAIYPQMYLYDLKNDNIIDSLINENQYVDGCFSDEPAKSKITVKINDELVNAVLNTDHIILKFILDTDDNVAHMNINQFFNLQIGVSVKSNSIEL